MNMQAQRLRTSSHGVVQTGVRGRRLNVLRPALPYGVGPGPNKFYLKSRTYGGRVYAFQTQVTDTQGSADAHEDLIPPQVDLSGDALLQPAATIPTMWASLAERHGNALALLDPHASPPTQYTFSQLHQAIQTFAAGLSSLGLGHRQCVSLISENSSRWLVADQAVMACGAADAVRGVASPLEELRHIVEHSQSTGIIVQDAACLEKLLPVLRSCAAGSDAVHAALRFVVLLWGDVPADAVASAELPFPVLTFDQVMERGEASPVPFTPPAAAASDDLATLVYTSGTTGHPKGVMLTHSNILYQVENLSAFLRVHPGERTLSLLPPWHIYERTCCYYILSRGAAQVYSNIRSFRDDLGKFLPDHLVCVPLVLDTLRSRVFATLKQASAVRRALAMALLSVAVAYVRARRVVEGMDQRFAVTPRPALELAKAWLVSVLLKPFNWLAQRLVGAKVRTALGVHGCVISGGGSLAPHLDDFFEAMGVSVLNGWGLTETSPVLACRKNAPLANVRGSIGRAIPGTELRVVDPETFEDVPDGRQGLLLARGPGVTPGYFRDPSATAGAFSAGDGWFSTGDLGWRAPAGVAGSRMEGCIVLTGRAKDTVVLSSGENVEPQPIEDAICCSPYVKFAILVGQGHRSLGALLVPDADALAEVAAARGVAQLSREEVRELMKGAVDAAGVGRVRWERVSAFSVLEHPFSVEDGTLTRTMKPRRPAIAEKYAAEIEELEARLR